MMKVIALAPLQIGREKVAVGEELELSDYSAQKMIKRGAVALPAKKKKAAKKPAEK